MGCYCNNSRDLGFACLRSRDCIVECQRLMELETGHHKDWTFLLGMMVSSSVPGAEARVQPGPCSNEINCENVCNGLSYDSVNGVSKCGIDQKRKSSVCAPTKHPKHKKDCRRDFDCIIQSHNWCAIHKCVKGFYICESCTH